MRTNGELSIADLLQTIVLSRMFWDMLICKRLPGVDGDTTLSSPEKSFMNLWSALFALPSFHLLTTSYPDRLAGNSKSAIQALLR